MSNQQVRIELELPENAPFGAPVAGCLVITNVGDRPLSLVTPLYNAALNIVVFDRYWNQAVPKSIGKAHHAYEQFELAPGQSATYDLADLTYTSGTSEMVFKLDPGIYYVVAVYHPGTARLPDQSAYPIVATSNVVTLVVRTLQRRLS
jgi:hypothetical protein